jgi:hypothetical protein
MKTLEHGRTGWQHPAAEVQEGRRGNGCAVAGEGNTLEG